MARILIADDEPDILESMCMQLELMGHEPVGVSNPDEILSAAAEHEPELILQDLQMGGMSLAGLVANLRTHAATAEVPLIFFSAKPTLPSLASKYGAWGYLPKPFTQRQLTEVLDKFLGEGARKAKQVGAREARDLFHDYWNVISALNAYAGVLANSTDLSSRDRQAADGIQKALLKLEALGDRMRSTVESVLQPGDIEAAKAADRPPRPPPEGHEARQGRHSTPPSPPIDRAARSAKAD